jgi:hypothetical protein
MQVYVAVYEHRHGQDIRVFTTDKLAEDWRAEIADEYWEEIMKRTKPSDRQVMADDYWERYGEIGGEFFNYECCTVEGL